MCPLYTSEGVIKDLSFNNALEEIFSTYKNDPKKLVEEVYPILLQLEGEHEDAINRKLLPIKGKQTTVKRNYCIIM
jgi:hypothetical protein